MPVSVTGKFVLVHVMKWYGAVEAYLHVFQTQAVYVGRWFHAPATLLPVNPSVST